FVQVATVTIMIIVADGYSEVLCNTEDLSRSSFQISTNSLINNEICWVLKIISKNLINILRVHTLGRLTKPTPCRMKPCCNLHGFIRYVVQGRITSVETLPW